LGASMALTLSAAMAVGDGEWAASLRPQIAAHRTGDSLLGDSVCLSERVQSDDARRVLCTDRYDLLLGQFGTVVPLPAVIQADVTGAATRVIVLGVVTEGQRLRADSFVVAEVAIRPLRRWLAAVNACMIACVATLGTHAIMGVAVT